MLLEGIDKPKVKQLSINRMKKQLLKIGCLLSVLFLFTSCVIDGEEYFVIKVDNGYEKKSELNESIRRFEWIAYNMRNDALLKSNWHILTRDGISDYFSSPIDGIYGYFSSTNNPWVGIDKVYFPKNFIKNMELEGEIDAYTFYALTPKKVKLPSSVTAIGDNAFLGCGYLESIKIPSSVTEIREGVFYGCSSLTRIKIDKANQVYDSRNNCNAIIRKSDNKLIAGTSITKIPSSVTAIGDNAFSCRENLEKIKIPSSVTEIGYYAFSNCSSLTSIKIPSSVTEIGEGAFSDCSSLKNIEIPSSVTEIGEGAFYGCSSLTSIEIPSSVTKIGGDAFLDCKSLKSMYLRATTPPSLGSSAFSSCPADFYVPMEAVEAYKNAEGWSKYASRIVGY